MEICKGLVSVIMSNFNTPEEYLRAAIESILSQTYSNIEFIIVDDCSTDDSLKVIESYTDERIIVIKNEENLGITKSLNRALKIAKGEFIARMDADDISFPERFQKQIDFLNKNSEIIVCGTGVELFGDGADVHKEKFVCKVIPERDIFQILLLFGNHTNIIHPTAMFRAEALRKNNITYNENYRYAQDYRMWVECSRYGECKNVDEVLLKYRIHKKAVSSFDKNPQMECARDIMAEQLSWLELSLPENWENIHFGFFVGRKKYDLNQKKWIESILRQNRRKKVYNQRILKKMLYEKWAETVYFQIQKKKGIKKIKPLLFLPIRYWYVLIDIKLSRR